MAAERRDENFKSMVEIWHFRINATPDADAMYGRRADRSWYTLSWGQAGARARNIACGLHALGIQKQERCAIQSNTRPEWILADMGILAATGATTTIYPSNTPDDCEYILNNSETKYLFVEDRKQLEKLLKIREKVPDLRQLIVIDGGGTEDGWAITLEALEAKGKAWDLANPGEYERRADSVGPEDLATLIYTSGTTGRPKGVMLTHDCWVFEAVAIGKIGLMQPNEKQYLFLPLAHSFAKVLECGFILAGMPSVVEGDLDSLVPNLAATRPTVMGAVPRIFEKVYNKVVGGAKEGGALKYRIFKWAVGVGSEVSALRQKGQEPMGLLALKNRIADKLVFSKFKAIFGGRIRFFISGGAPLSKEIAEFFHAADILVLEGYGLTESSAATFVNRPDNYKFGSVGLPVPGVTVRIGDEGEILLGGRGIMRGYYKLPEDSARAFTEDGMLRTGDVGVLDSDGFLRITGRIKDIIVTAGGKNIAPQEVEAKIKNRTTYVSQVVMLGDKRPFCIALVTINEETVGKWARENGVSYTDYGDLAGKKEVHDLIWKEFEAVNAQIASYESIKRIHILDHDLSIERGEMTPKMSIKRNVVEKNYADVIESFYAGTVQKL